MAENQPTTVMDDDQPIALRRKRRSCGGVGIDSQSNSLSSLSRAEAGQLPPTTPRPARPKKKARISDPGPVHRQSSGLTPFIRKASLGPLSKTHRRRSAPVRLLNRNEVSEPVSGEIQFAPLVQLLDGRVKRRIKRFGLSEEFNNIDWQKKHEAKSRRAEVHRLRQELEHKDIEIQTIRDDQELASQIGFEVGASQVPNPAISTKIQQMEHEIEELKAELSQKEQQPHDHNDWTMGTRDPFDSDDDDDNMHVDEGHDKFNMEDEDADISVNAPYEDVKMTTNYDDAFSHPSKTAVSHLHTSFPSPPATVTDTHGPSKIFSFNSTSTQASFPDPLTSTLQAQLVTLQSEIKTLTSTLALNKDHESRLSQKISSYVTLDQSHDQSSLDSALDSVLTTLTLAQAQAVEKEASFNALSNEVVSLGFSTSSDETIEIIAQQFRSARLDLEYLSPGENAEGFENVKLLAMLIERLKHLVQKTKQQDATIDRYHEQEIILRQQLSARIDALHDVQKELSDVVAVVDRMNKEVVENEVSNEKLRKALEEYRREIWTLEKLIERIESEHKSVEEDLQRGLRTLDDRLQHEILKHETLSAEMEGHDIIVEELQKRLNAALEASASLQDSLHEKDGQLLLARRDNDEMLSEQDERVASLQEDLERTLRVLKNTQMAVESLRNENSDLKTENEDLENIAEGLKKMAKQEKSKGKRVVENMRSELFKVLDLGRGFIESEIGEDSETETGEMKAEHMKEPIVKKGRYLNASLAKRKSGGVGSAKKDRRKYDSGLGFLEEDEEDGDVEEVGLASV